MTKDFSPVAKLAYMTILLGLIYFMVSLSYGWSISQTAVFSSAITGAKYAIILAWFIQLLPQGAFVIAGEAGAKKQTYLFWGAIVAGITFNLLDTFTNIVTFMEMWPQYSAALYAQGRSAMFVEAAYPVGLFMAFAVTWFEELVLLAFGTVLMLSVEFAGDMHWKVPATFRAFVQSASQTASRAGGNVGKPKHDRPGYAGQSHGGGGGQTHQRPSQPQPVTARPSSSVEAYLQELEGMGEVGMPMNRQGQSGNHGRSQYPQQPRRN